MKKLNEIEAQVTTFEGDIKDRAKKALRSNLAMYGGKRFKTSELESYAKAEIAEIDLTEEQRETACQKAKIDVVSGEIAVMKRRATMLANDLRNGKPYLKSKARNGILQLDCQFSIQLDKAERQDIEDFIHYRAAKKAVQDHNHECLELDFQYLLDAIGSGTIGDLCE